MNDNIFAPKFEHTDEIKYVLEKIERNSWLVDRVLIMPKHEAWIRRDAAVKRASGTTRIEGASLDEQAVGDLFKRSQLGKFSDDEQANINAKRAYEFVDYLSDQPDVPLDELVIREINRYFLDGVSPTLTPGAYRKGQNTVGGYTPPNQGDVPGLMRSFAVWLREDHPGLHPVLKAGIAHIQLVAIHPFWDGNGRTARALSTLLLQRSNFSFKKLLSLEAVILHLRDQYFSAIERTLGTQYNREYDVTPSIIFFADALGIEAQGLTDRLTDWHRMMSDFYARFSTIDVNVRQTDGFVYSVQAGSMTRADYVEVTGASPGTASRDLKRLVQLGLLIPDGRTRDRVYRPAPPDEEPKSRGVDERQLALEVDAKAYGPP